MGVTLPDCRMVSDEVRDALRQRAVRARELGYSGEAVAEILGVTQESVSRWYSAYRREGIGGLPGDRTGSPLGVGRLLNPSQEERIQQLIDGHCPDQLGIPSALWTRKAIRELIVKECSVKLSIRSVGEYLRRWGYTPQKPLRKSYKQKPEEVRRWLKETYPIIEARAQAEGAEIHWGDETGVRSCCHAGRGYARPGHTPVLTVPGTRFSVNMVSSITNQGKVRFMIYCGRMTAALFVVFLSRLIDGAEKKIFLIVDNLKLHDALLVRTWVAEHQEQIELFMIPKYSPEVNPDEYLNCDVKANIHEKGLPHDREELKGTLNAFMHKLAQLPARVASYFRHPRIAYAAAAVNT
jgi:transposase